MHLNIDHVADMTGEERLRLALLLSELDHEIIRERVRRANPEWSEKRVRIEFFRIIFLPKPLPKWLELQFMAECDQFSPEQPIQTEGLPARYTEGF